MQQRRSQELQFPSMGVGRLCDVTWCLCPTILYSGKRKRSGEVKWFNLALQSVGAHRAFIRVLLDSLLDDEEIKVAGIIGTSVRALNGAALKSGLVLIGRDGARECRVTG